MGVTAPQTAELLRAERLERTFVMGTTPVSVLRDTSLSIKQGEFVAIEGRSGSGKSTLLHILAGLDAPDGGRVIFDGIDIAALSIRGHQRRKRWLPLWMPGFGFELAVYNFANIFFDRSDLQLARIRNEAFGFVFQFYHLLPELNVLENTLLTAMVRHTSFGFRSNARELTDRAADLLNSFGLGERLKHPANRLSGGERQRVAIARALMNQPRVLFADEPTGNLDADTGRQIMGVLEDLHQKKGQTIVMVTHDRTLARRADRVLVLQGGKLAPVDPG